MKRTEICVYILTHNRPETILRSLNSVRNQRFNDLTIIVSDNSTNDDTGELVIPITFEDKRVIYIKRGTECNTAEKHMNYILKYNSYRYFMMFHDDDEMLPDMIEHLYTFHHFLMLLLLHCLIIFQVL